MGEKSDDCLGCRLVSGFGIIGVGVYIYFQAKRRKAIESYTMKAISTGAVALGVARLLNLDFLRSKNDGPS